MDPDDARRSCLKKEPQVDFWSEGGSEPESARGTGWGRWRARYDDSTTATDNPPEGQPWVPGAGADSTRVPQCQCLLVCLLQTAQCQRLLVWWIPTPRGKASAAFTPSTSPVSKYSWFRKIELLGCFSLKGRVYVFLCFSHQ